LRKHRPSYRKPVRRKPIRKAIRVHAPPSLTFQPNTVYQFSTRKQALADLPEDARCILLLGGHIVNELTTLNRLLLFSMKVWNDPIENTYASVQYWTITRLIIGKVAEGLDVFQRRILGKPFGRTNLPLVEMRPEGAQAVVKLKMMLGDTGLLRRLRNHHTFHNPSDDLLTAAFAKLSETENWSMMAATSRHTVLFPMSNVVVTQALIDATGKADIREAIELIRDELLNAADALILFFESLTIAISDANDLFFGAPVAVKDTRDLPDGLEVRIPPLCRDTK